MFHPSYVIPLMNLHGDSLSSLSCLLIRTDGQVLQGSEGFIFSEIPDEIKEKIHSRIPMGNYNDQAWVALGIRADNVPPGYTSHTLREIAGHASGNLPGLFCRGVQLIRFDLLTRFCGFCGSRASMKHDEIAKVCSSCGRVVFPRLSPAVIVRITDGENILLSRSPHFPPGMYSVQAGFVEPGESLEAAVHREVREEVGIEVTDIRYFGSQPWPFPDSLMIGFTARYAGGEIISDKKEIEDAGWFTRSTMPHLPGHDSIAYGLIHDWLSSEN